MNASRDEAGQPQPRGGMSEDDQPSRAQSEPTHEDQRARSSKAPGWVERFADDLDTRNASPESGEADVPLVEKVEAVLELDPLTAATLSAAEAERPSDKPNGDG